MDNYRLKYNLLPNDKSIPISSYHLHEMKIIKPKKICIVCNRPFEWRKKWKNCWEQVKYCSKRCQNKKK